MADGELFTPVAWQLEREGPRQSPSETAGGLVRDRTSCRKQSGRKAAALGLSKEPPEDWD